MENAAFEGVVPIEHGDIPASYVGLPEGNPPDQIGIARRVVRAW